MEFAASFCIESNFLNLMENIYYTNRSSTNSGNCELSKNHSNSNYTYTKLINDLINSTDSLSFNPEECYKR